MRDQPRTLAREREGEKRSQAQEKKINKFGDIKITNASQEWEYLSGGRSCEGLSWFRVQSFRVGRTGGARFRGPFLFGRAVAHTALVPARRRQS